MFRVTFPKQIDRFLPLIEGEPTVLLFVGVPILFTGRNKYGNYIVGSSVDEDHEKGFERYFHIIVSRSEFRDYQDRKISYLDLLKQASKIYVIYNYSTGKQRIGSVTFSEIPVEYRPTSQTYFPETAYHPSWHYSSKIEGGIADGHLAMAKDVSITQNAFSELLTKGLNTLSNTYNFIASTMLEPSTANSYSINYKVELSDVPKILVSEEELWDYLNDFVKFCIKHLPKEVEQVLNYTGDVSDENFEKLVNKALELLNKHNVSEETIQEVKLGIKADVLSAPKILKPLSEVVRSSNYTHIDFDNNFDQPLATFDNDFATTLDTLVARIDAEPERTDDSVKIWEIIVYSFNTHSGNGQAELIHDKKKHSIRFNFQDFEQEKSKPFIRSMLEDELIPVKGIMSFKNEKPVRLEVRG